MSKKLLERYRDYEAIKGRAKARAEMCNAIGKSERTLLRWLENGAPTAHDVYTMARTMECTDKEALALARECFPEGQRTA